MFTVPVLPPDEGGGKKLRIAGIDAELPPAVADIVAVAAVIAEKKVEYVEGEQPTVIVGVVPATRPHNAAMLEVSIAVEDEVSVEEEAAALIEPRWRGMEVRSVEYRLLQPYAESYAIIVYVEEVRRGEEYREACKFSNAMVVEERGELLARLVVAAVTAPTLVLERQSSLLLSSVAERLSAAGFKVQLQ